MAAFPPFPDDPLPSEYATCSPHYPVWLLHQATEPLFRFLDNAGLLLTQPAIELIGHVIFSAAATSRMLLEHVHAERAGLAVLAATVEELLLRPGLLTRFRVGSWRPAPPELDVLASFCQTGSWKMDRPAELVDTVRRRVRRRAVRRLEESDALVVGLMLTVECRAEIACRMLDLESDHCHETLGRVWRRFEQATLAVVEDLLSRAGRQIPVRYTIPDPER